MRKSHGRMPTYARPAFSHVSRSLPLRVYTSSNAAQPDGSPAAASRLSWAAARSGLVVIARSSGIPAARRRSGSLAHRSGMYTSKSAHACPDVVTYAENTVVTQFSTWPVHPACCGATHAVASPCLSCAVSSIAMPGPIRSPGSHGSHAAASPGSSPRRSAQSHRYDPSSACIRCGPSCPASSATDQQFAFTPGDSADRYPNATSTLRRCASTRPRTALTCASTLAVHVRDIVYAGPRGRVVVVFFHKAGSA